MKVIIKSSYEDLSKTAARIVAKVLNAKPNAVLGLSTGTTSLGLYRELIRLHRDEGLDFSQVTTFNVDEYVGLTRHNPQSFCYFIHEHFLKHVNISPQNVYIPAGTTENYLPFCEWYDRRIAECGGIDLQILGIGEDGRIGFNEPCSSLGSRTRVKTLAKQTVEANVRNFDSIEEVPVFAITMGVGTILEARRIVLLANGKPKAPAIAAAVEGPITAMCTASALQLHRETICVLDRDAASGLKMVDYYDWCQAKMLDAP